jgi:hypothetical protein
MKTTINIELTHEEAYALASFLPSPDYWNEEPTKTMGKLKEQLCEILGIKSHDL